MSQVLLHCNYTYAFLDGVPTDWLSRLLTKLLHSWYIGGSSVLANLGWSSGSYRPCHFLHNSSSTKQLGASTYKVPFSDTSLLGSGKYNKVWLLVYCEQTNDTIASRTYTRCTHPTLWCHLCACDHPTILRKWQYNEIASVPGSLLKNKRREPANIHRKSCWRPAHHSVINVGHYHFGNNLISCHTILVSSASYLQFHSLSLRHPQLCWVL